MRPGLSLHRESTLVLARECRLLQSSTHDSLNISDAAVYGLRSPDLERKITRAQYKGWGQFKRDDRVRVVSLAVEVN